MKKFANHCLDRMTFGATSEDIQAFNALGGNNDDRLSAYVNQQLDWSSINDSAFQARVASLDYQTLDLTLSEMWQIHHVAGDNRSLPGREMERFSVARALHSKRQLLESLTDFWHNHFNVYLYDFYVQSTLVSWDRDVIRPPVAGHPRPAGLQNGHLMGNFRQMLELSSQHAAMQRYLDNYINQVGGPNENYAREVMELHTLGSENYLPLAEPNDIPTFDTPMPWGNNGQDIMVTVASAYSDNDVYSAMRMLTGWKIKDRSDRDYADYTDDGSFFFYEPWHDTFEKTILGHRWGNNAIAPNDIREFFDLLAYHPATAQHIAGKLCRRFISYDPPQSVIDNVAATFYNNRYASDQLERTYRTLLNSSAFKNQANWGVILKKPAETLISAMRVANTNYIPAMSDRNSNSIISFYMDRARNRPFYWQSPDGYPMEEEHWLGGNALMYSLRGIDFICDRDTGDQDEAVVPLVRETQNAGLPSHTPNSLAAFWLERVLGYSPDGGWQGTSEHTAIRTFMQKNYLNDTLQDPDEPFADISENRYPQYVHERLRGMIKLVMSTPDFLYR